MTFLIAFVGFVCAVASCLLGALLFCAAEALQEQEYPAWAQMLTGGCGAMLFFSGGPGALFFFILTCGHGLGF